jgi:hypothetical protein
MGSSPLLRAISRACYNKYGAKDFCYNDFIPMILYFLILFPWYYHNYLLHIFIQIYLQTMLGALHITFRLFTTFCQPEQGICEASYRRYAARTGKMRVEAGVGMDRSGMT